MIYFRFLESRAKEAGFDFTLGVWPDMGRLVPNEYTYNAYEVFEIYKDGRTIYYKDRSGKKYQYTKEEQVVIKLSAHIMQ